jgi:phosphoenolpyruvate carboxylase
MDEKVTDEEKEALLTKMLTNQRGLSSIAKAMANPISRNLDYTSIARRAINAKRRYDKIIEKTLIHNVTQEKTLVARRLLGSTYSVINLKDGSYSTLTYYKIKKYYTAV